MGPPSQNNHTDPLDELPSQVELDALKRAFRSLDVDGDGKLSCQDVMHTLQRLKHKMSKVRVS